MADENPVQESRRNERLCARCYLPFNAWESNRTVCYLCDPNPVNEVERLIREGKMEHELVRL